MTPREALVDALSEMAGGMADRASEKVASELIEHLTKRGFEIKQIEEE